MIPVFQTRYASETFGNCFEACLASILELPLSAIPDRAALVDHDAWADRLATVRRQGGDVGSVELSAEYDEGEDLLREWLRARGLAWVQLDVREERQWLEYAADIALRWIAHTRHGDRAETSHATVWLGEECVHNPTRGASGEGLGHVYAATLLVASEPAKLARLEPLPDVRGEFSRVKFTIAPEALLGGRDHDRALAVELKRIANP